MESLIYLLIYFIKGSLPWQGINAENREEKYKLIGKMKRSISLDVLCEGLPKEFLLFIKHVRELDFKEKPNYSYLRSLIVSKFKTMGYFYDCNYDWKQREKTVS